MPYRTNAQITKKPEPDPILIFRRNRVIFPPQVTRKKPSEVRYWWTIHTAQKGFGFCDLKPGIYVRHEKWISQYGVNWYNAKTGKRASKRLEKGLLRMLGLHVVGKYDEYHPLRLRYQEQWRKQYATTRISAGKVSTGI